MHNAAAQGACKDALTWKLECALHPQAVLLEQMHTCSMSMHMYSSMCMHNDSHVTQIRRKNNFAVLQA